MYYIFFYLFTFTFTIFTMNNKKGKNEARSFNRHITYYTFVNFSFDFGIAKNLCCREHDSEVWRVFIQSCISLFLFRIGLICYFVW